MLPLSVDWAIGRSCFAGDSGGGSVTTVAGPGGNVTYIFLAVTGMGVLLDCYRCSDHNGLGVVPVCW